MKNIAIVFFSGSGHTTLMAEAIRKGAASVSGTQVTVIPIQGKDITEGRYQNDETFKQLAAADAIIFGSPTFMGGPAAQFKAFADASGGVWFQQGWKDKVAGGFTVSGSPSGDKLNTQQYFSILASQHGMVWVNGVDFPSHYIGKTDGINRLGSSLGVIALNSDAPGTTPTLHPGDAQTVEDYGRRVAEVTIKYRS